MRAKQQKGKVINRNVCLVSDERKRQQKHPTLSKSLYIRKPLSFTINLPTALSIFGCILPLCSSLPVPRFFFSMKWWGDLKVWLLKSVDNNGRDEDSLRVCCNLFDWGLIRYYMHRFGGYIWLLVFMISKYKSLIWLLWVFDIDQGI